jgi:polyamine oxidase
LVILVLTTLIVASFALKRATSQYTPVQRDNSVKDANFIDYCVIGMGFAGASSIETLVKNNVTSWLAFEKQARVGGRVHTVTIGSGSTAYNVEGCAQWIQGDNRNPILKFGQEMTPPLGGGHAEWESYTYFGSDGLELAPAVKNAELSRFWGAYTCVQEVLYPLFLSGELVDMTVRDCYAACGYWPNTPIEWSFDSGLSAVEWGETNEITSCMNSALWVAYSYYGDDARDTANFVTDSRGLSAVVEHFLKGALGPNALTDSRIRYRHEVTTFDTSKNTLMVKNLNTGTTDKYQCKFLISTITTGQIQEAFRTNSGLITPAVPIARQVSWHKYHTSNYRKIFLQYNTKFWPATAHFTTAFANPGLDITSWTSLDFDHYYPGSKILLASHNGPESNKYENIPDETYVRLITGELERIFGPAASFANLTANGYKVTKYTKSAELRGTYSNRGPTLSPAEFNAMFAPVGGHFFWSGEAACDALNGYVTGAYLIGKTNALRALKNNGAISASVNPEDNECFRPPAGWNPPFKR